MKTARWVRVRIFLGSLVFALAGSALGSVLGVAGGLNQRVDELSTQNLHDGIMVGIGFGVLPGLVLGAVSQERFARSGRARILWTSPIHSFVLTFLFFFPLIFVWTASDASC